MAEVLNGEENCDARAEANLEVGPGKEDNPPDVGASDRAPVKASSPPLPPPSRNIRGRERDFRERRDERESDRPARRDHYEHNRSPPPPPLRERDINKRNRLSPSPPPPAYRDRRGGPHSPPRRSPPFPSYKRRRDDAYDDRRGRSSYEYSGGYEREMGARLGYPDERFPGRHMGRVSVSYLGDWDSGRGAISDAFIAGGKQREGMMSYKQFIQELEDDILPAEAEKRYQEYKSEYISTQKRNYFSAHKDEEWLKDKYHPTNLLAVIERRNELMRKLAKEFRADLENGTLDVGPDYIPSSNKTEQPTEANSDNEADSIDKRRRSGHGVAKDSDHHHHPHPSAPKAHLVFSESRRIPIDIDQVLCLVQKLDSEKGIEDNILLRSDDGGQGGQDRVVIVRGSSVVRGLEGVELLDTILTYLWRAHGIDYYGLIESTEPKGLRHVRIEGGKRSSSDVNGVVDGGEETEKKFDSHWQKRVEDGSSDPLELMVAKTKIEEATIKVLEPYIRKIRDEKYGWKYGCGAKGCTKLFHAAQFVQKHLRLKHPELVEELTSKVCEELYFDNYMNDENAPGGKPLMQQHSTPKDRLLPTRGAANGSNKRFDRSENPRSGGDNTDETALYDSLKGIPVAAFPLDMPPPFLMPVPGAGPLGPFVPAPPEVAMQMLRDQGGNGRTSAPIIAMPRDLRRYDPRSLRSYNDLDALDDEIIDYRSL